MRVSVILLVALLATSTFAATSKMRATATAKRIDAIKQQGGWASIILDMAELHAKNSHPLDELKEALANVIEDLGHKLQVAHDDFAARTEEHEETVNTLHQQINHAIEDQTRSQDNLRENLYPTVEALNKSIADSERLIDETEAENVSLAKKRTEEHAEYQQKIADADNGIKIMEECIEAVHTLLEGGELSLAQLNNRKETFAKAEKVLAKSGNAEFKLALALTQLATNNKEIDTQKVKKIIDLFHQNINNLVAQKTKWTEEENRAETTYQTKKADNEALIEKNRSNITDCEKRLEIVHDEIKATEEFIARRKADQAKFEKELQDENDAYEQAKKDYEELVAQIQTEIAACKEALSILDSANFSDVIETRLNDGNHIGVDWQQSRDNPSVFGEGYEGIPN